MKRIIPFLFFFAWLAPAASAQMSRPFELENGVLRISFDKNAKTWSLFERESGEWKSVISNATSSLAFRNRDSLMLAREQGEVSAKTTPFSDEIGRGSQLEVRIDGVKARWTVKYVLYDAKKILTLSESIQNASPDEWKPDRLHLLDIVGGGYLGFDTANVLMHVNGYQSWSDCEVVKLDSAGRNTSYWSTVFYSPDTYSSLLIGFLTNSQATNFIRTEPLDMASAQLRLSSSSDIKILPVAPGGSFRSDRFVISFDPSPLVNLERYGEYLQAFAPPVNKPFSPTGKGPVNKSASSRVPTGWCSWYYYYQHISEDSILLNLNAAARELKEAGLRYIQIDDGYQIAAGEWDANAKFPHGHRWLVDRIHEKGFLAGLWVAPFAIAESSSIYAEHRDWLLKDAGDTLKQYFANEWWGGRIFSLDPTKHEVQMWLENLFYKITTAWGYDYVKIDFLYFPLEAAKYSLTVTPPQAYQMGLQAIRRGVGSDRFILGCGAPIGSSIGFVDGMRVGTDIYAGWGGIMPGASAAANRWFYHRSVWYDDPDCLVVREPLTLDQARVWAAVVALSGQMNMMSDKLTGLSAERLSLLRMTLPGYGQPARPVDLFTQPKNEGLTLQSSSGALTIRLPDSWKFSAGDTLSRKDPAFDDSRWSDIAVPARWEDAGYPGLDGFAWYRVKFSLPSGWDRGPVTLYLGKIDDCDETYLNGALIGKTGAFPPNYATDWTSFRVYRIPEHEINWDGENTLALRVYDGGGAGGLYSSKQSNLPSVWNLSVAKDFEKWNVVGVFNWSGDSARATVDLAGLGLAPRKKYLVYERWSDRYLGEFGGSVQLSLKATSSQILSVHENPDRPLVLSTSRHLTGGAVDLADEKWDGKLRTLAVTSDNLIAGTYTAAIYIPAGFEFKDVISPMKYAAERISNNILRIDFSGIRKHSFAWKVRFN